MSKIQVNEIVNHFDNGAPDCPKGLTITGVVTATTADFSGNVSIGGTLTYEDVTNIDSVGIITAQSGVHFGLVGSGVTIDAVGAGTSLGFLVNGSERVRIDNSGRLLVGTSTARAMIQNSGESKIQLEATNGSAALQLIGNLGSAAGPVVFLGKSRGTSLGSTTVVQNGDTLGSIQFAGADGSDLDSCAAQISCQVDGTPGSNDMPGRLVFSTTADAASSPTERMRISQNGYFDLYTNDIARINANSTGSGTKIVSFRSGATAINSGTERHYFTAGGAAYNSTGTWGTISDAKLKENIVDAASQWDDISKLKVRNFNFKEATELQAATQIGFIAQEVEQVSPGLVDETLDTAPDDLVGNISTTKTVKTSVLFVKAVKALQEAMERIETLEAEVAALKGA